MKIEKTVHLDLIELINYIQENDIRDMVYNGDTGAEIEVTDKGKIISLQGFDDDSAFTLKIFESITEDTVIPRILVKTNYDDTAKEYNNSMINEFVPIYTKAIYILNDDLTMTLIWRNGKLVE